MRISKIEYENFRNFRDHGEIRCSTDGRVTIIYGKNGDGKTTLHQLFQWVFYGQVHFNKTTTDRLYNLQFESEQPFGSTFEVMGRIDFEHNNEPYTLTRTYTYKKGLNDSEKIAEDLSLNKMDQDHNWKRLDRPKEVITLWTFRVFLLRWGKYDRRSSGQRERLRFQTPEGSLLYVRS